MTTKPTRSLAAAPNAAARMQELLRQQATPPKEKEQVDEEVLPYSNTQVSNSSINQPAKQLPPELPKEVRKTARRGVSTPMAIAAPAPDAENLHTRITSRLGMKEGKEATVRLSIDVSERLHERIKVYCASNRIPTTRALVVALLENLLDEAGY